MKPGVSKIVIVMSRALLKRNRQENYAIVRNVGERKRKKKTDVSPRRDHPHPQLSMTGT
jgi:hypothetical protein